MKLVGKGNSVSRRALKPAAAAPVKAPTKKDVPIKRPLRFTGKQRAMRSCQEVATTPAPKECQAKAVRKTKRARAGFLAAKTAERTMTHIGRRSRKKPILTTIGFLRVRPSTKLAVNNWGKYQAPWEITAAKPMAMVLSVNLLMYRGTIVAEEIKLRPNQKLTTSAMFTLKFQR